MPTRNVNLTHHYDKFIDTIVADGRFSNASEAVRAGLYLLERQAAEDQAKLDWLRGAAQEGLASLDRGEGKTFGSVDELADYVRKLGRDASTGTKESKRVA